VYFRGLLADQREETVSHLARSRTELRECMAGEQVVGLRTMARMRSEVRELEAKKSELDRLIAARPALLGAVVAAGLDAQAHQLLFGAALHEQRYEIPDGAPVEPRMIHVDHRGDSIRRHVWVDAPEPDDQLFNCRPLA
jgi:hypothetical protein